MVIESAEPVETFLCLMRSRILHLKQLKLHCPLLLPPNMGHQARAFRYISGHQRIREVILRSCGMKQTSAIISLVALTKNVVITSCSIHQALMSGKNYGYLDRLLNAQSVVMKKIR